MNQTDESEQGGQNSKICKLAVASPLVVILGFLAGIGLCVLENILQVFGIVIVLVSLFFGLILGIIADRKICKSNGILKGRVFSILGTGIAIVLIIYTFIPPCPPHLEAACRVVCGVKLSGLGRAIRVYDCDYDRYPTPNAWCDLLIEYAEVNEDYFICNGALKNSDKGPCHYALNPNCSPNSPNDVVLLFETKGGWNQFGGPKLLTVENHEGKGCIILFNDSHVDFIKTENLGELKWGDEPENKSNQ